MIRHHHNIKHILGLIFVLEVEMYFLSRESIKIRKFCFTRDHLKILLISVNANILYDAYRTPLHETNKRSITTLLQYKQYA